MAVAVAVALAQGGLARSLRRSAESIVSSLLVKRPSGVFCVGMGSWGPDSPPNPADPGVKEHGARRLQTKPHLVCLSFLFSINMCIYMTMCVYI